MKLAALILRVFLGVVLLYAAYTKLKAPWLLFAMSIDAYQILPSWGSLAVARVLPWLELVLGLMLIGGVWLRWVAGATTVLLGVFFALMIYSYSKGMGIDCGCFGVGEALTWKTLVRDGALLAASGLVLFLSLRNASSRRKSLLPAGLG